MNTAYSSIAFQLDAAPLPFRQVSWEAEFSDGGLKRLGMCFRSEPRQRADTPKISARQSRQLNVLKKKLLSRLKGGESDFDWEEFDLAGTGGFHQRVWKAMRDIPFGATATYGEVAEAAGSPMAFRACGQACNANRIVIFVPCHRVVAANGLGGFGCGLEWKKRFLALEQ